MPGPKVVNIRAPSKEGKPQIVAEKQQKDDDYSALLSEIEEPAVELRKEHVRDFKPSQPKAGQGILVSGLSRDELMAKIEEDRKKRRSSLLGKLLGG